MLELGGNAAVIVDAGRRSRRCGRAHRSSAPSTSRARAASACSGSSSTSDVYDALPRHARRQDQDAGRRAIRKDREHLHRPDDRREGGEPPRQLDPGGGRPAARNCCAAASATARCSRRRCSRMSPRDTKLYREEAFGPVAILIQVQRLRRGARRGQRQQVRAAGRHLHPRPVQGARRLGPARRRRRRRSTTCRATASTTCPMAGSRIRASAAKACASRWRT